MFFTILPFILRPINITWMGQQNTNSKRWYLSFPIAGCHMADMAELSGVYPFSRKEPLPCLALILLPRLSSSWLESDTAPWRKGLETSLQLSKINLCSVYPLLFVCFDGVSVVYSWMYSQQRHGGLESLSNVSKMTKLLTGRSIFNTKFIWSKLHILFTMLHFLLQVPKAPIQCFFISVSILHHEYFTFHQINLKTK